MDKATPATRPMRCRWGCRWCTTRGWCTDSHTPAPARPQPRTNRSQRTPTLPHPYNNFSKLPMKRKRRFSNNFSDYSTSNISTKNQYFSWFEICHCLLQQQFYYAGLVYATRWIVAWGALIFMNTRSSLLISFFSVSSLLLNVDFILPWTFY